eukprot:gene10500-21899_t
MGDDRWNERDGGYVANYSVNYEDAIKEGMSRILFMGPRRSGKSSIERVVFHKMSPHETLFLESTTSVDIHLIANNNLVKFQTWDFCGDINLKQDIHFEGHSISTETIFKHSNTLIYVIDCQEEDYEDALPKLVDTIAAAHNANPTMHFEIFLHKVDGDFMSEETKSERQQKIQQYITTELSETSGEIFISYYLTSIYDHSALEAFSKVVQNSSVDKSYLIDVPTKLYIATDSNPVDALTYELCSDLVDVIMDVSCIYGVSSVNSTSVGPFDEFSSSAIHLDSGLVLYLREVNSYLALVCVLREEQFAKRSLLDYNIDTFKTCLEKLFS